MFRLLLGHLQNVCVYRSVSPENGLIRDETCSRDVDLVTENFV